MNLITNKVPSIKTKLIGKVINQFGIKPAIIYDTKETPATVIA